MSQPPSWSAVLDKLQEAIALALRDVEARTSRFAGDEPAPSRSPQDLEAVAGRLARVAEPVRRAEATTAEADAALAEVEEEVRAWRVKAGRRGGA